MKAKRPRIFDLGAVALIVGVLLALPMMGDIQDMKQPRYRPGKHLGAAYCGTCHQDIYRQWSTRSRHALATQGKEFLNFRNVFMASTVYASLMGESMCYACHGPKSVDEGVNCETCHGPAIAQATPEDTYRVSHATVFAPGLTAMKNEDFCAKCHELKNPMSGASLLSVHSEWKKSTAAQKDLTCQSCHMKREAHGAAYHGFDSSRRSVEAYAGLVEVKNVRLTFPQLSMNVINRVDAHAIPAAGPSKALALKVDVLGRRGEVLYSVQERFAKVFSLTPVLGVMPWKPMANTQLQSGEVRPLVYTLPDALVGLADRAVITLRFYEISDVHQGDLSKAHWISEPIFEKMVKF